MTRVDLQETGADSPRTDRIVAAWVVTLLASTLPDAGSYLVFGAIPAWLFGFKIALLLVLIIAGATSPRLRPLGLYFVFLCVNIGGWQLFSWIRALPAWSRWEGDGSWAMGMLSIQFLKIGLALLTLLALFALIRHRESFFLAKGNLGADVTPVRWLGVKDDISWKTFGPIVAVVAAAIMLVTLVLANQPTMAALVRGLPLLPAVLLFAATNAFAEEVSFRSSLLAPLLRVVGTKHAMGLTAVFFGMAHYSGGVPFATAPTILMTGFLGWLMAKSMLETRGLVSPWFIHCVADIPVFAVLALASVAAASP